MGTPELRIHWYSWGMRYLPNYLPWADRLLARKRHGTYRTNQIITDLRKMQGVFRPSLSACSKQESFVYSQRIFERTF